MFNFFIEYKLDKVNSSGIKSNSFLNFTYFSLILLLLNLFLIEIFLFLKEFDKFYFICCLNMCLNIMYLWECNLLLNVEKCLMLMIFDIKLFFFIFFLFIKLKFINIKYLFKFLYFCY